MPLVEPESGDQRTDTPRQRRRARRWLSLFQEVTGRLGEAFDDTVELVPTLPGKVRDAAIDATDPDDWRRAIDDVATGSWTLRRRNGGR